jgi:hypothetical protein
MKTTRDIAVLQISAAYPPDSGGVATHVANLAHGLLKLDRYRVFVLTSTTTHRNPKSYHNGRLMVRKVPVTQVNNFSGRRAPFDDLIAFLLAWVPDIRSARMHVESRIWNPPCGYHTSGTKSLA